MGPVGAGFDVRQFLGHVVSALVGWPLVPGSWLLVDAFWRYMVFFSCGERPLDCPFSIDVLERVCDY